MSNDELTLRTELRIGSTGRFARATDIADGAVPGAFLQTPDANGLLWAPIEPGSGPSRNEPRLVIVSFDRDTGIITLMQLAIGMVFRFAQIDIADALPAGSVVQLGTSADPDFFLSLTGPLQSGSYSNDKLHEADEGDLLVLTVSPQMTGTGKLYYEVQS